MKVEKTVGDKVTYLANVNGRQCRVTTKGGAPAAERLFGIIKTQGLATSVPIPLAPTPSHEK